MQHLTQLLHRNLGQMWCAGLHIPCPVMHTVHGLSQVPCGLGARGDARRYLSPLLLATRAYLASKRSISPYIVIPYLLLLLLLSLNA
jgi:hypothetical protein